MKARLMRQRGTFPFFVAIGMIAAAGTTHGSSEIVLVHPREPVTDVTVSVHDFDRSGAIRAGVPDGAALKFSGLLLFVEALGDGALDVEVALADPDDPFMPLKNFALGDLIGPDSQYGERGDVIFTFPENVAGMLGFRFSTDGGLTHRYGWVQFQWETKFDEGTVVDRFVVQRAAWMNAPNDAILAGQLQAGSMTERLIQIRSVDVEHGIIELFNFDVAEHELSGWQFCTHDENEIRRCTDSSGLDDVRIEAGTPLYVHLNNDAPPGDPDRINRSSLGPPVAFALPLDTGPYSMQLHFPPVNFENGATIADHLQWNVLGTPGDITADRSDEAEAGGVWTNQRKWIVTRPDTDMVRLTGLSGAALHGPGDYEALGPAPPPDAEMIVFLTGQIEAGFDTHGTLGFGVGADLAGRALSGVFVYLPNQAPEDDNDAEGIARHLSMLPESAGWLSFPRFKIDGVTVPQPDFAQVSPDPKDPTLNDDQSLILLLDDIDPISDGFSYNRIRFATDGAAQFADMTMQLDFRDSGTLLHSANIGQPFVLADPSPILENNFLASASTVEGFEIVVTDFTLTTLTASLDSLRIPGDSDGDGVVELQDFGFLPECIRGPDLFPLLPDAVTCLSAFDFDADDDVDLHDFSLFQRAFGFGL